MKTSGVYKITNTVTGDFYIGSSKDIKHRWTSHKWPSTWKQHQNNPMYLDMQKYGTDKFELQILAEVEIASLKKTEQKLIEKLHPTYNQMNAKGLDIERFKEYQKEYRKEYMKEYMKEYQKEYQKSDKYKEYQKKYKKQICFYNGKILTLRALSLRFYRAGIEHPTKEARKYLLKLSKCD